MERKKKMTRLKTPTSETVKAPTAGAAVADMFNTLADLISLQETKINDLGSDILGMKIMLGDFGDPKEKLMPTYTPVVTGTNLCKALRALAEAFAASTLTKIDAATVGQIEAAKDFAAAQSEKICDLREKLVREDLRDRNKVEKTYRYMPMNYDA
jgi:hypothetical protein